MKTGYEEKGVELLRRSTSVTSIVYGRVLVWTSSKVDWILVEAFED